ncbi:bola protein [Lasiosphaeris hirsuta]|uniref:Bola protein n=1 Tax=Lasiosphaeris hirsuta TaxID=260670 RepID=A0AA40DSJ5_9PEZI|nr:bola protein [Lasiosphaeris hirsuta]
MICRTCLRARAGLGAEATRPAARRLLQTISTATRTQPLSSSTSTHPPLSQSPPLALFSRLQPLLRQRTASLPPSRRPFSSSRVAAQEQEASPAATPATSTLEKPDSLSDGEAQIWDRLVGELEPVELVVRDISGGCGSMYMIDITSERFRGLNMLKQQRTVNAVLGDMVKEWHGVRVNTRVP